MDAMVGAEQKRQWDEEGYLVVPGLFSTEEADSYREYYMDLRATGEYPGDFPGVDPQSDDPLKRYPRMIHMHRWDERSLAWLTDARLNRAMTELEGVEPYAVQTMLYFKPPGARGQALHQDQFYLKASPGTCMAAWMALDRCDVENGCMVVVPGTHRLPVLCTTAADTRESFTDVTVPVPEGMEAVPVEMHPGDVLFFNGQLIHGSYANRSGDRFRRALIGHYLTGRAERVAQFYAPVYRMDGSIVELGVQEGGGPCGVWVDRDGRYEVEMRDVAQATDLHE
jgi:phytanoyl-CoA hydroxylase